MNNKNMITISVKLNGAIKYYFNNNTNTKTIELPEKSTIKDVLKEISLPENRVGIICVNEQQCCNDRELKNGDQVALFPIVVGG